MGFSQSDYWRRFWDYQSVLLGGLASLLAGDMSLDAKLTVEFCPHCWAREPVII